MDRPLFFVCIAFLALLAVCVIVSGGDVGTHPSEEDAVANRYRLLHRPVQTVGIVVQEPVEVPVVPVDTPGAYDGEVKCPYCGKTLTFHVK